MSSSILRVKDKNGNWISIPAIRGDTPYIKNGTWWIGEEDTGVIVGGAMVATGSYVGTGTYGTVNGTAQPTTLTFNFEPQLVVIAMANKGGYTDVVGLLIKGMPYSINFGAGEDVSVDLSSVVRHTYDNALLDIQGASVTFSARSVSILSNVFREKQFNASGVTYYYVAIGSLV